MSDERIETEDGQIMPPLYLVCVEENHLKSAAIRVACGKALSVKGRVGLFSALNLEDFQNWATVEGSMKQELREQREKELWTIAGAIREEYGLIPEFFIEEGQPHDALQKILGENKEIQEIIVSMSKRDIGEYTEEKSMKKLTVPLIFIPETTAPS